METEAKKNVVAIHKFITENDDFNIEILVRDKGKSQYLYEIKFIEKQKCSQQSMTDKESASPAPNGDVENDKIVTQESQDVKTSEQNSSEKVFQSRKLTSEGKEMLAAKGTYKERRFSKEASQQIIDEIVNTYDEESGEYQKLGSTPDGLIKRVSTALNDIDKIVKNAVLLDTKISEKDSNSKMENTAFMHSFYTLYNSESGVQLLKLYVEEALSNNEKEVFTRAYELKDIQKIADAPNGVLAENSGLTDEASTINSIADLFELVKTYDKEFSPKLCVVN